MGAASREGLRAYNSSRSEVRKRHNASTNYSQKIISDQDHLIDSPALAFSSSLKPLDIIDKLGRQ